MNVINALLVEVDALMAELKALFPESKSLEDSVNWVHFLTDESLRTETPEFLIPWFQRIPFPFETELLEHVGLRFMTNCFDDPLQVSLFDYLDVALHIDLEENASVGYEPATFDPDRPVEFVGVQALRWVRWAFRMVEWDETESVWWSPKRMLCARPGVYFGVEVPRQENEYHRFPVLARYSNPLVLQEPTPLAGWDSRLRIARDICEGWLAAGCPVE